MIIFFFKKGTINRHLYQSCFKLKSCTPRCLHPTGMIADDVGLGKTITAGLVARELLHRGHVESILVVCPKTIMHQWKEELRTKFNINARDAVGGDFSNLKSYPVWINDLSDCMQQNRRH